MKVSAGVMAARSMGVPISSQSVARIVAPFVILVAGCGEPGDSPGDEDAMTFDAAPEISDVSGDSGSGDAAIESGRDASLADGDTFSESGDATVTPDSIESGDAIDTGDVTETADALLGPDGPEASDADADEAAGPVTDLHCFDEASYPPHCKNGIVDLDEVDIDCGGSLCARCTVGSHCLADADCLVDRCTAGHCASVPIACTNGVKDSDESDADCGGSCIACADSKSCGIDHDCSGGHCIASLCASESTVAVHVTGSGRVTSSPLGIDCPTGSCLRTSLPADGGVILTATPDTGWAFEGWGGCPLPSGATCTIATGVSAKPVATFSQITSGMEAWKASFTGAAAGENYMRLETLAPDRLGGVVIGGEFRGTVGFGGGSVTSSTWGETDIAIARYLSDGTLVWAHKYGGPGNDYGFQLKSDASGNTYFAGTLAGTASVGGAPLSCSTMAFLAKYSPSGAHLWSRCLTTFNVIDAVTDNSGNLVVLTDITGVVDLGAGPVDYGLKGRVALVRISAIDGSILGAKVFHGYLPNGNIARYATGGFALVGQLSEPIDFGGGSIGLGYWFITATFDESFTNTFVKTFGSTESSPYASPIATLPDRSFVIAGEFDGTFDLGCGDLVSTTYNAFAMRFDPSAARAYWTKTFHAQGVPLSVATNAAGTIVFGSGSVSGTMDFGAGPLATTTGYVVKYDADGFVRWARDYPGAALTTINDAGEVYVATWSSLAKLYP